MSVNAEEVPRLEEIDNRFPAQDKLANGREHDLGAASGQLSRKQISMLADYYHQPEQKHV